HRSVGVRRTCALGQRGTWRTSSVAGDRSDGSVDRRADVVILRVRDHHEAIDAELGERGRVLRCEPTTWRHGDLQLAELARAFDLVAGAPQSVEALGRRL